MDILVDTLSFRANFESLEKCTEFLGIPELTFINDFEQVDGKYNFHYHIKYQNNGIIIACGGTAGWGYYIYMSGKGCRTYEDIRGLNFDWFPFIQALNNLVQEGYAYITRIDLACDEREGVFNIKRLEKYISKDMYISKCLKSSITLEKFGREVLYVGSPQSKALLRIYNKKLERGYLETDEEIPHWWRCEFQVRDEHANQILKEWAESNSVGTVYSGHVLQHIRFLNKPNKYDGHQCRIDTAYWWRKFLDFNDSIKWVSSKGSDYNLTKLERYAIRNAGSSVKTMILATSMDKDKLYDIYTNPLIPLRADQKAFIAKCQRTLNK